jgi:hypothetical protein
MKSQKARKFVKTMEVEYNAKNKMINSTVAKQAVQMAEIDLTKKAIEAYKDTCVFNSSGCCQIKKDAGKCDCKELKDFIEAINV